MDFDLHEINYLWAIGTWAIVFFGVFSLAAIVAVFFASLLGQRQKLNSHLTGDQGSWQTLCWVMAGVGALAAGGAAWMLSDRIYFLVQVVLTVSTGLAESQPQLVRYLDRGFLSLLVGMLGAVGGYMLVPVVAEACTINLGRVWTIAMLTWKEAVRRRALYVFVVFAMLFMFAGWFLGSPGEKPDRQVSSYVTFVLTAILWLTLPVMLLLSTWGIPEDIRVRSMHTVVTKPIRRNEIYLGRVVGFSLVGSLVVLVIGTVGYLWISRQIPALVTNGTETVDGREVEFGTTRNGTFRVSVRGTGDPEVYRAESPAALRQEHPEVHDLYERARAKFIGENLLTARKPVHGRLSFYDRNGIPAQGGINVGDIWEHRSYIECGTQARASYTFDDVDESMLVDHTEITVDADGNEVPTVEKRLRIETNFEAFRSYKGDLKRSLLVQLHFVKGLRREFSEGIAGIDLSEPGVVDFRPVSRAVAQGNFAAASQLLSQLSVGFETQALEFTTPTTRLLPRGYRRIGALLDGLDDAWAGPMATAAREVASAVEAESHDRTAAALQEFSGLIAENLETLEDRIVDVDVPYTPFEINEFTGNTTFVPRELTIPGTTDTVDLFEDLVHGGKLRIEVAGLDAMQYLGMARPDLFVRMPDRSFLVGFAKAVLGIWLLLVLVVLVGVTVSTFVKGPVGMFAVASFVIVGMHHDFLVRLVTGQIKGSGSIESAYKLQAHLTPTVDLDATTTTAVIKGFDSVISFGLWVVSNVIPDLNVFLLDDWIASGFDIQWGAGLAPAVFTLLAYLLPCLLLGFYSLKLRELESK